MDGRGRFFCGAVAVGAEREPAASDFVVGPGLGDIGACAQDEVVVVIEDGVVEDVDGEDGGEELETVLEPGFTVGEVATGGRVEAAEEGAADAAAEAMVDADGIVLDEFAARKSHD